MWGRLCWITTHPWGRPRVAQVAALGVEVGACHFDPKRWRRRRTHPNFGRCGFESMYLQFPLRNPCPSTCTCGKRRRNFGRRRSPMRSVDPRKLHPLLWSCGCRRRPRTAWWSARSRLKSKPATRGGRQSTLSQKKGRAKAWPSASGPRCAIDRPTGQRWPSPPRTCRLQGAASSSEM